MPPFSSFSIFPLEWKHPASQGNRDKSTESKEKKGWRQKSFVQAKAPDEGRIMCCEQVFETNSKNETRTYTDTFTDKHM